MKRPETEPSGWAFEYANDYYPDIDDTAMVLLALSQRARRRTRRRSRPAIGARSTGCWPCSRSDGGWAAFDADNNWEFLSQVPFADHNAMLDPTCADITGPRAGSAGGARLGRRASAPCGAAWIGWCAIRKPMEAGTAAGAWRTFTAPASRCADWRAARRERPRSPRPARRRMAALHSERRWRLGRKLRQLRQRRFTPRRSTPSQTAWAILGLIAGGDDEQPQRAATASNICWKRSAPMAAGTKNWPPAPASPRCSILNYHLYKDYFPLLALSSFVKTRASSNRLSYEISTFA